MYYSYILVAKICLASHFHQFLTSLDSLISGFIEYKKSDSYAVALFGKVYTIHYMNMQNFGGGVGFNNAEKGFVPNFNEFKYSVPDFSTMSREEVENIAKITRVANTEVDENFDSEKLDELVQAVEEKGVFASGEEKSKYRTEVVEEVMVIVKAREWLKLNPEEETIH